MQKTQPAASGQNHPTDNPFAPMVQALYQHPQLSGLATHRARPDFLYRSNESGVPLLYHWDDARGHSRLLTPGREAVAGYAALHPRQPWVVYAQDKGGSENYQVLWLDFASGAQRTLTPQPIGRISQIVWLADDAWLVVGGDMHENYLRLLTADGQQRTLYRTDRWLGGGALDAAHERFLLATGRGANATNFDIAILNLRTAEIDGWLSESDHSEESHLTIHAGRVAYTSNVDQAQEQIIVRHLAGLAEVARVPAPGDVASLSWLDEQTLLAVLSRHAVSQPYLLHLDGPPRWTGPLGDGSTWSAAPTSRGAVWVGSSLSRPGGLYRAISHPPEALIPPAGNPAYLPGESHWYTSFDGQQIQGWLLRQPGRDTASLVVYIHGGPTSVAADQWRAEIQALAQAGFHVFVPNYRGSTTFGTPFRLSNIGDLGGGDLQDVLYGARYAGQQLGLATLPLITGRSYGGYLTLQALTTQPEAWAGGVAVVPVADWREDFRLLDAGFRFYDIYFFGGTPEEKPNLYRDRSPITHLPQLRAPTLILHGENDSRCPIEPVIHFADEARRLGLPVELVITPAEGHGNLQNSSAIRDTMLTLAHLAAVARRAA